MKGRAVFIAALALLVVGWYAVRAGAGWIGGIAYSRGQRLGAVGAYEEALPLVERGAVGFHRPASRWFAGQVRMGIWQSLRQAGEPTAESEYLLAQAYRDYTAAISMSPVSGWYWAALADLYQQRERSERFFAGVSLDLIGENRWSFVGRPGRVAIGLNRLAIEREPNVYALHDQLAFEFLYHALEQEALDAVRHSAAAQPIYYFHKYRNLVPTPPEVKAAFLEASREALGHTPLLRRVTHLIWLGRLEIEMGLFEAAEADLRAALDEPGQQTWSPALHFYLGQALAGLERYAEADQAFLVSQEHPSFEARSAAARGEIARAEGRLAEALDLFRHARRLSPRVVGYTLEYAKIARQLEDWERAEEALRWARTVAPRDWRPIVELVESRLARGDLVGAQHALDELRGLGGSEARVQRLEALMDEASAP
jgi:tetratricopeptide (TPR) repeat protein